MRKGVNPEKFKTKKNSKYLHRIIIPIHVPNIDEGYYKDSLQVLDFCLESIVKTINKKTTAISIVNNASIDIINKVIEKYFPEIDKIVNYNDNKGKVYAVYSEAKSAYEPFITIADADVFFFSGWENAVFNIFNNYRKAGVVSPVPSQSLAFYNNYSLFFDNIIINKLKYDKIVTDLDCELYLKGMGNKSLLNRDKSKFSWMEKQYYLEKKIKAIIGSGHFVATYRREVFDFEHPFPEIKFKRGYENKYLDEPADRLGLYRLSTVKNFAYHLGGKVDDFIFNVKFDNSEILQENLIANIEMPIKNKRLFRFRKTVIKIFFKLRR